MASELPGGNNDPRLAGLSHLSAAEQQQVLSSVDNIHGAADAVRNADGKDAQQQAGLDATKTLADELSGHPKDVQAAILDRTQGDIGTITEGLNKLDGGQNDEAVKNLSRAAEAVGQDNVSKLTDPMAAKLPKMLDGHRSNMGELSSAIKDNIKDGNGALLGASLTDSLRRNEAAGETKYNGIFGDNLRDSVANATKEGIEDVRKEFEDKAGAMDQVHGEVGRAMQSVDGFGFSKDEIESGAQAVYGKNQDKVDAYEAASEKLASTLEGASFAADKLPEDGAAGELRNQADKALEQLPRMRDSEAGLEAVGKAVENQADGRRTFLDGAEQVADRLKDGKKWLDNVGTMVVKGGGLRAARALSNGDFASAEKFFDGLRKNSGLFKTKPETLDEFGDAFKRFRAGDINAEQLSGEFSRTANKMSVSGGHAPGGRVAGSFKMLGVALGAASLAKDVGDWGNLDNQERLRSIVNAADLGADTAEGVMSLLGKTAPKFLKLGGAALGGVGAAFDFADAVKQFSAGDFARGGASLTSAAGGLVAAGAVLTGSGVGALVGIGLMAGGAIAHFAISRHRAKDAEKKAEGNFEEFLKGAGMSDQAAHRLRDLDGDHRSMWGAMRDVAPQLGVTPEQLLNHLTTNVDDRDLRHIVDTAEMIPRDDDGNFKMGSPEDPWMNPWTGAPESVHGFAKWLQETGFAP
jgi:hypothetical protein